jgi:hypothetical protein
VGPFTRLRNLLLKSGTVTKVDQKYLEVFKFGNGEGWRRSFGPTLREIRKFYFGVKEERNILHTINKRKADLIGHLLHRNCRLKDVIERKIDRRIEMTGGRVKRRKNLMDDLEGKRMLEVGSGNTRSCCGELALKETTDM